MKTIKCKITNEVDFSEYVRKYNSVLHIAYNSLKNGISQSNIKKDVNQKFIGLNSFIIQNAIVQAQGILTSHLTQKQQFEKKNFGKKLKEVLFGGRANLRKYLKGYISKDEFKANRLKPMVIAGETRRKGNRLFDLDFENDQIIFKPKRGIKIPIEFACSKKQKEELLKIQELCLRKEFSIAIGLSKDYVTFCFDEEKLNGNQNFYLGLKANRVLGIDQNPNYLGLSIIEFDNHDEFKILHKRIFDLSKLTKKSGKSSDDKKSKYLVNKRHFETINLAYEIDKLVKSWHIGKIVVEDLEFNSNLVGKARNRLCKNAWNRCLFSDKLKMLSKLHGYEFVEVNAAYSSIVGNIVYGNEITPDMIAASIEIARRGYKKFEKGWFYPDFRKSINQMNEQWKQTSSDVSAESWKDLFKLIKESKLKYRISLDRCKSSEVLSLNSLKSLVSIIKF